MGHAVSIAVVRELRVLDEYVTAGDVTFEDAILIVVEVAVANGPVDARGANARAVFRGGGGARELDIVDHEVTAGRHPDALILRAFLIGVDVRASVDADDRQVVLGEGADVAAIEGGLNLNGIAVG